MPHDDLDSFADDARRIRERLVLDLTDRGARAIDANVRSLRSGTRKFASSDRLIGLGEGLRDLVASWGVPEQCIFSNDTSVNAYFVDHKFWDFAVRDSVRRELALAEFTNLGNGSSPFGVASRCHQCLGLLYDYSRLPPRPFTGIIAVTEPPRMRKSVARRLEAFTRFDQLVRQAGLLDAMAYVDLDRRVPETDGPHALTLANFIATLYAKLAALPPETWPRPAWSLPYRSVPADVAHPPSGVTAVVRESRTGEGASAAPKEADTPGGGCATQAAGNEAAMRAPAASCAEKGVLV